MTAKWALAVGGEVVGAAGAVGEVMAVIREPETTAVYHVLFDKRVLQVPESALEGVAPLDTPA